MTTLMQHPGILLSRTQLDYVKGKLANGGQPWASALAKAKAHGFANLARPVSPVGEVRAAGPGNAAWLAAHLDYPQPAGDLHDEDAAAAYTCALVWYYTRDQRYADKAKAILDAWSSKLTGIAFDQPRRPDTGGQLFDQGKLQAGWAGALFARAGELLRHTTSGWPKASGDRLGRMLRTVHLPLVASGWPNGAANWLMTFAEAQVSIGVYLDDRAVFDAGVAYWRANMPGTITMPSGLQAETLRDLSHMAMGMGAMVNAAETARAQGVDLYGEQQARIVACYETQASWVNQYLDGATHPVGWPSANAVNPGGTGYQCGWELAYAEYARRRGVPMPHTGHLVARLRPSSTALHMTWETLTHARA